MTEHPNMAENEENKAPETETPQVAAVVPEAPPASEPTAPPAAVKAGGSWYVVHVQSGACSAMQDQEIQSRLSSSPSLHVLFIHSFFAFSLSFSQDAVWHIDSHR